MTPPETIDWMPFPGSAIQQGSFLHSLPTDAVVTLIARLTLASGVVHGASWQAARQADRATLNQLNPIAKTGYAGGMMREIFLAILGRLCII